MFYNIFVIIHIFWSNILHILGFSIFVFFCVLYFVIISFYHLSFNTDTEFPQKLATWGFVQVKRYLEFANIIKVNFKSNRSGDICNGRIIISNHISVIDIVLLINIYPNAISLMAEHVANLPFLKTIAKNTGFVIIKHNNYISRIKAISQIQEHLKNGKTLIIFPEGTRSKTGKLGIFNKGIFRIALECHIPLTPVLITSSNPFYNKIKNEHKHLCTLFNITEFNDINIEKDNNNNNLQIKRKKEQELYTKVYNFYKSELSKDNIFLWQREINNDKTC